MVSPVGIEAEPVPVPDAPEDRRARVVAAIDLLEDSKVEVEAVLDKLHELADGPRVQVVIDLTDPPTPVRVYLGELVGEGETADDATRNLGVVAATQLRASAEKIEAPVLVLAAGDASADAPVDRASTKGG